MGEKGRYRDTVASRNVGGGLCVLLHGSWRLSLWRIGRCSGKYNLEIPEPRSAPWCAERPLLTFREDKTTQAAARFLERGEGTLPYISLIKLLYYADREALKKLGRPISYDFFVSMNQGPVLSNTLDLIRNEPNPGEESYWHRFISPPDNYEVRLLAKAGNDQLSQAEEAILDRVWGQLGWMAKHDRWALVRESHKLPEWTDPDGTSLPIDVRDILRSQGLSAEDANAIIQELQSLAFLDALTDQ